MSRRVVSTADGVKLVYEENKLIDIIIPEKLEYKRQQIMRNAMKMNRIKMINGKPIVESISYAKNNNTGKYKIASSAVQNMGNYLKSKSVAQANPLMGVNVQNVKMAESINSNSPQYKPIDPNNFNNKNYNRNLPLYVPASPGNERMNSNEAEYLKTKINACRPNEFLYREFKSMPNKSYFNYVTSNGNKNILSIKKDISRGIVPLSHGSEGASFVGCLDRDCKKKVAIKVGTAAKTNNNQEFKRNWNTSPAATEFKIQKHVFDKVKRETPHIVEPYAQFTCSQDEAFVNWSYEHLQSSVRETMAGGRINILDGSERLVITYFEFYNGGDMFNWLRRHKSLSEKNLKSMVFAVLWTMKVIYEKVPSFRHNDIHLGNIFVRTEGIPTTGTTKYGKFEVPNNGIFVGLGDFGWADSENNPNPRVNSGLYKNQGVTRNKSISQDLHFFLNSLWHTLSMWPSTSDKFKKTKDFVKEALNGDELITNRLNNPLIKNMRLLNSTVKIKEIDAMLDSPYFDELRSEPREATTKRVTFRDRIESVLTRAAPTPKPNTQEKPKSKPKSKPKPVNKLSNNLKIAMIKESDYCGKRRAPTQGGGKGMSIDEMVEFIKEKGTAAVKDQLRALRGKKPKRAVACGMMASFKEGRKRIGMDAPSASPAKEVSAPKVNANFNERPAKVRTAKEIENFINRRGTQAAKNKMRAIKKGKVPTRSQLISILKTFENGKKITNVPPPKARNAKPAPKAMVIPKTSTAARRIPTKPTKPVIRSRSSASDRKAVLILTNRLYNASTKVNKKRENFEGEARKKYFDAKNKMVKAGLINSNESLLGDVNLIVPPGPGAALRRAAAIRNSPRAVVAKTPRASASNAMNAKSDLYEYTVDSISNLKNKGRAIKTFRVNGKLVRLMDRPSIDRLLRRVGVDPKTVKSKQDAVVAIIKARLKYVTPYKTKAQKQQNEKAFKNKISANYEARQNQLYRARLEREKMARNAERAKRNANTKVKTKPINSAVKGKLALFSRLNIK